jgi:hypothetical protein
MAPVGHGSDFIGRARRGAQADEAQLRIVAGP